MNGTGIDGCYNGGGFVNFSGETACVEVIKNERWSRFSYIATNFLAAAFEALTGDSSSANKATEELL
ncbi:hypothetical protein BC936DRAFT_137167 [Jimgerdemannia flammicorona]|uniref:Uncharacterized protein n=1 Tax=Jimgerdemannia flammicorona TaxID=994334 RepID=A0A433DJC9_9FUNG|nr:hypothetical protein BC936DRAFT_137167 [Jimgerdemannia flammicorona]